MQYAEDDVLPPLRQISDEVSVETAALARVPPLVPEDDSSIETLIMALAGTNQTFTVSYGTEAGVFREAGIPAVVCGPGDIMQAHRPNEFITIEQMEACTDSCAGSWITLPSPDRARPMTVRARPEPPRRSAAAPPGRDEARCHGPVYKRSFRIC